MGRRPRTGLSEAGYNADAVSWEESPHWRTPLTVPIDGGMRELGSKWVLIVGFGLMMLASGCGTVPPSAAGPARVVHFVIVNLSDCAWQITLPPTGGATVSGARAEIAWSGGTPPANGRYVLCQGKNGSEIAEVAVDQGAVVVNAADRVTGWAIGSQIEETSVAAN